MDRIFALGSPAASSATIVGLAIEAGVKRVALTHRHKDLKDAFYVRAARSRGSTPELIAAEEKISILTNQLSSTRTELLELRDQAQLWARLVRGLELDNQKLRDRLGKPRLRLVDESES